MTFYHQEVLRLNNLLYSKDYLVHQVREAKIYMDRHFACSLQLGQLAMAACLSKFHFARLFKQYYGRTPLHYLTEIRIAHAKALLAKGVTVAEACEAVGFCSITTFTACFKKATHHTPGAYRKRKVAASQTHSFR